VRLPQIRTIAPGGICGRFPNQIQGSGLADGSRFPSGFRRTTWHAQMSLTMLRHLPALNMITMRSILRLRRTSSCCRQQLSVTSVKRWMPH